MEPLLFEKGELPEPIPGQDQLTNRKLTCLMSLMTKSCWRTLFM